MLLGTFPSKGARAVQDVERHIHKVFKMSMQVHGLSVCCISSDRKSAIVHHQFVEYCALTGSSDAPTDS